MFRTALRALLLTAALPALATPPDAPELIYDAAPKQILFDWNYVPRANWYEIWFQSGPGAVWAKMGERPSWYPHRDMNVSAHLLDWGGMRWDVRACNPGGCSSPRSIDLGSTVVNTVGYVKAITPESNGGFGAAVDVSEDGSIFVAVQARYRAAMPRGQDTAVANVYRKVNGRWQFWVGIVPLGAGVNDNGAGINVTLSADGSAFALGVPAETYGIGGTVPARHGAVYVIRQVKNVGGWNFGQRFTSVESSALHTGAFTKLSDDGNTLAFSVANASYEGLETYRYRAADDSWERQPLLLPEVHQQVDYGMSGDGKILFIRTRTGTAVEIRAYDSEFHRLIHYVLDTVPANYELAWLDVDATGTSFASGVRPAPVTSTAYVPAQWKPRVTVYRLDGPDYQPVAVLAPSRWQPTLFATRSLFGDRIAMSSQGTYVAIYDPHDTQGANGVQLPPSAPGIQNPRGSIYLFEKHGTGYRQRRHIGANGSPDWIDGLGIFGPMAFGRDGKTFVVGSPTEDGGKGAKEGIRRAGDPETSDKSQPDAGAVWLY